MADDNIFWNCPYCDHGGFYKTSGQHLIKNHADKLTEQFKDATEAPFMNKDQTMTFCFVCKLRHALTKDKSIGKKSIKHLDKCSKAAQRAALDAFLKKPKNAITTEHETNCAEHKAKIIDLKAEILQIKADTINDGILIDALKKMPPAEQTAALERCPAPEVKAILYRQLYPAALINDLQKNEDSFSERRRTQR